MKKRLAFIDHNFHQKSRSADFLREIFKDNFIIDNFWWSLKDQYNLIELVKKYDNFFFFQSLLPLDDMLLLKNKNVMWAPMYDNLSQHNSYWKKIKYLDVKILSFSTPVKKLALKYKCKYLSLKYSMKNNVMRIQKKNKIDIFFWFRGGIKFYDWINKFDSKIIKKITFFNCPDPGRGHDVINRRDIKKFNVKIIKKSFLPKKEYLNLLRDCDVFVCPRKQEGIGMSFLEAMSMGKYIISYNDATMKDYILNRKIGFLFDRNNSEKINLKDILKYKRYRIKIAKKMYKNWTQNKTNIIKFFINTTNNSDKNIYTELLFFSDFYLRLKQKFKNLIFRNF